MSGPNRSARPANPDEDGRVSLHPLEFDEALEALLNTPPEKKESDDAEDS